MSKKQHLKQFEDFLSQQESENNDSLVIDYEKDKQKWLAKIDEFYKLVQEYIRDYIKQGKISEEWRIVQLQEDHFGEYEVKQLTLKIGKKRLIFKPVGRFVIGCQGRIDLISDLGTVRFLLVPKNFDKPSTFFMRDFTPQTEWLWKIASRPPKVNYLEITEETFFEALMEVVNA